MSRSNIKCVYFHTKSELEGEKKSGKMRENCVIYDIMFACDVKCFVSLYDVIISVCSVFIVWKISAK
jgi:hypothetical protein